MRRRDLTAGLLAAGVAAPLPTRKERETVRNRLSPITMRVVPDQSS